MPRKKKRPSIEDVPVSLNVMPFIDIFSLLCTFLLFSAVFLAIGVHEVQIPFLSNAAPKDTITNEPKLEVQVDVSVKKITLQSEMDKEPKNKKIETFDNTQSGRESFHQSLLVLKQNNPKADGVKIFADDDISYENLILILDKVKFTDPEKLSARGENPLDFKGDLFPKVILSNIL